MYTGGGGTGLGGNNLSAAAVGGKVGADGQ